MASKDCFALSLCDHSSLSQVTILILLALFYRFTILQKQDILPFSHTLVFCFCNVSFGSPLLVLFNEHQNLVLTRSGHQRINVEWLIRIHIFENFCFHFLKTFSRYILNSFSERRSCLMSLIWSKSCLDIFCDFNFILAVLFRSLTAFIIH